jgi:hypothetical protein
MLVAVVEESHIKLFSDGADDLAVGHLEEYLEGLP